MNARGWKAGEGRQNVNGKILSSLLGQIKKSFSPEKREKGDDVGVK